MWAADYDRAVTCGRIVSDALSNSILSPYRALWYYYVATAAYAHTKLESNIEFERITHDYLNRAKTACQTVSWFPHALRSMLPELVLIEDASEIHALAVEGIVDNLITMGSSGLRFKRRLERIDENLRDTEADKFDLGLMQLGNLLGFTSYKPGGSSAPDAVWYLENHLLLMFEGKSDEAPEVGISVQNCRQTSGHLDWVKVDNNLKDIKTKFSILVSPRKSINKSAIPHGEKVHYMHISEVLQLFEKIKQMLIELRSIMTDEVSDTYRVRVLQSMQR